MTTRMEDLDWRPSSDAAPQQRTLLLEPPRAVTVLGGLLIVLGSLLPWASGVDQTATAVNLRATEGQGEGVWLLVFGLALIALTLNRGAAESRSRTIQLAPMLIAVCAALMWITADRNSRDTVALWIRDGGTGSQTPVVSMVAVAILLAAAGAAWFELRRSPEIRAQTVGLRTELGLTRRSVAEALGAVIGAGLGVTLGLAAGIYFTNSAIWSIGVLIATGIGGLLLGFSVGLRLSRLLVH